jgi:hypothetical protein
MLTKNVYLLYPPGYSGSYVNWAINISDQDRVEYTVKNPINISNSEKLGGSGTSHLHVRVPTHQAYSQHVNWMLLNRPVDPGVYIINSVADQNNYIISELVQHDPTGIIINIHNGSDPMIDGYGAINSALKWPVRYLAGFALEGLMLPFDPFNCASDIVFRNWAVSTECGHNPVDYQKVNQYIQRYLNWYHVRHTYHAHEVNKNTYITNIDLNNQVFELSCLDIATPNFIKILLDIMNRSQCSDNYDLTYLQEFHKNYIDAQENLQWFESVKQWTKTGQLDQYLQSHAIIQAQLIKLIFELSNINVNRSWKNFYNSIKDCSWPKCDLEEEFVSLPSVVQQELIEQFQYQVPLVPDFLNNQWIAMSLEEINNLYQSKKILTR